MIRTWYLWFQWWWRARITDEGETESRYRAAAKLRLSGNGEYTIEALYGLDPHDDPVLNGWPPSTTQVKVQWPREIEVDALGNVLRAQFTLPRAPRGWLQRLDPDLRRA